MTAESPKSQCYACLRINPQTVFNYSHRIFEKKDAHVIAAETSDVIRTMYEKAPWTLSGKHAKLIIAGLFYILGVKYQCRVSQRKIAFGCGVTEQGVRANYMNLMRLFPELFPKDWPDLQAAQTGWLNSNSNREAHNLKKGHREMREVE